MGALRAVILFTAALIAGLGVVAAGHVRPGLALAAGGPLYVLATAVSSAKRPWSAAHHTAVTVSDMLLIATIVWLTGGSQSEYYLLYYIPVMSAGLRLNSRDGIAACVLAFVCYCFIAVAMEPREQALPTAPLRVMAVGSSALVLSLLFMLLKREMALRDDLRGTLHTALKRVAAVYDLAHAANRRSGLSEVLAILLNHAARASRAADGAIFLADDGGDLESVVSLHARAEEGAEAFARSLEWARQALDSGLPVTTMATRTGDLRSGGRGPEHVCVPLVAPTGSAGVLVLAAPRGRKFSRRQTEFLETLCSEAALAIENARLRSELGHLAVTDHLTGLANRRAVEARLEDSLSRSAREHRILSLMVVDLDSLKAVNDEYGHAAGDEVLCAVADALRGLAEGSFGKVAGRLGGDEFMVVLPRTDLVRARGLADSLVERVQESLARWPNLPAAAEVASLTGISVGIAATDGGGLSAKEIVRRADMALYEAKRAGGRCARLAPETAVAVPDSTAAAVAAPQEG
jgi:diguanylate cyclase (GGDEF)-like protein